ncbi:hypothetical protein Tco_0453510 [Tanacetum coccineum]
MLGARELITNPTAARAAIWVEAWDNENWPIVDSVVGGGGPGGPGGGGPRGGGGGDRRGGRGGDRRGGIGDGRRDSRGRRYGPGSGSKGGKFELGESRGSGLGSLLTGSSLLAALFKARKDDERHQESRQARPNYASTSWRHPTSSVGRKSNVIFALPDHGSTSSVSRKSNAIFALPGHGSTSSVGRKSNVIFAFPGHRSTSSVGRKSNVIFALPGHRSTSSVGCKSNAISGRKLKIDMAAYGWKVRTSPRR